MSFSTMDFKDIYWWFSQGEQQVLDSINIYMKSYDPNTLANAETGKTALHYAAEHRYKIVAETLLEHGMNGLTKDKSKFKETALGLAIRKKYEDMSAVIARHMKPHELRILFGTTWKEDKNIDRKKTELDLNKLLLNYECDFTETIRVVFDSLQKPVKDGPDQYYIKPLIEDDKGKLPDASDFNHGYHTVFQNLAERGLKEVVCHPIVRLLINHKWETWARKKFARNFVLHILSLISLTVTVVLAGTASDVKTYDTSSQRARVFFEVAVLCFVIKTVALEIIQVVRHGFRIYYKEFLNWLDLASALLLLIVIPVRYIDTRVHWYIFALGYLLWVIKVFKYAVVFSQTGTYAESLRKIFWRDLIPFSILFGIVNLAFGGTFFLILKGDGSLETHDDTSSFWGILYVGLRTMIEAQPIVEYTGSEGYRPVGTIVMLIFMSMTIVVLLNILIAQLSDTYQKIQTDAEKSVLVNRAWTIARSERNNLRLCYLREILKKFSPSRKTWPQTEDETNHQKEDETSHQEEVETSHQEEDKTNHQEEDETSHQEEVGTSLQEEDETSHQEEDEKNHQEEDETSLREEDETSSQEEDETSSQEEDETSSQEKGGKGFLPHTNLKSLQLNEMEEIISTLARIENKQVKSDLEVQTLKSRVRTMNEFNKTLLQEIQNIQKMLKESQEESTA